jgi:hypothetical protein
MASVVIIHQCILSSIYEENNLLQGGEGWSESFVYFVRFDE